MISKLDVVAMLFMYCVGIVTGILSTFHAMRILKAKRESKWQSKLDADPRDDPTV